MNINSHYRKRNIAIKEILAAQEVLNERKRELKAQNGVRNPFTSNQKIYPTRERRKRAEELFKRGSHTPKEIVNILVIEFPEYEKVSHYNLTLVLRKK